MKRIISYISLIIVFTILGVIGLLNKPSDTPDKILNTTYYKYNTITGEYESIRLNEKEITYNGNLLDLDKCNNYTYNKKTNILKLNCGKAIKLVSTDDESITLNINNEDYSYYKTEEDSYNKEFLDYFKVSEIDYITEGKNKINEKMVNLEKLEELTNTTNTFYLYLITPNCTKKCILLNNNLDLLTTNNSIFAFEYSQTLIDELNEYASSPITDEMLNKENPLILKIENKKISKLIELDIKGFNIEQYNNYLDDIEVENE